jgi:hypothetical protein
MVFRHTFNRSVDEELAEEGRTIWNVDARWSRPSDQGQHGQVGAGGKQEIRKDRSGSGERLSAYIEIYLPRGSTELHKITILITPRQRFTYIVSRRQL